MNGLWTTAGLAKKKKRRIYSIDTFDDNLCD